MSLLCHSLRLLPAPDATMTQAIRRVNPLSVEIMRKTPKNSRKLPKNRRAVSSCCKYP
jgi:hypothetical protein